MAISSAVSPGANGLAMFGAVRCALEASILGTRSGPILSSASTRDRSRKLAMGIATLKKTVPAAPVRIWAQSCACASPAVPATINSHLLVICYCTPNARIVSAAAFASLATSDPPRPIRPSASARGRIELERRQDRPLFRRLFRQRPRLFQQSHRFGGERSEAPR